MCGILIQVKKHINHELVKNALAKMSDRGPDYEGICEFNGNVVLGHRRLSIIDLSPLGNQPMADVSSRYHIVFNGEIYNYRELKRELLGIGRTFVSNTDTEVIINGFAQWGVDVFRRLNGPFAIGIYDKEREQLSIARDRSGEKPLFYRISDGEFTAASNLISACILTGQKTVSQYSASAYLINGYPPSGTTLIEGIYQLEPGRILEFDVKSSEHSIKKFWDIPKFSGNDNSLESISNETERLLRDSVKNQLHCDVETCILLSGGLDSSLLTAIAADTNSNINTFTVKFQGHAAFDESLEAKKIAEHFSTNHVEIEGADIQPKIIDEIIQKLDSPINDSSLIPTYLVYQAVSSTCRVALGGDGGDEVFGGYRHYSRLLIANDIKNIIFCKNFFKDLLSQKINNSKRYKNWLECLTLNLQEKVPNIRSFYNSELFYTLPAVIRNYVIINSQWMGLGEGFGSVLRNAISSDFNNYLSSSILVKSDRMSMANSVEARAPFLDINLIDFSFKEIPDQFKAKYFNRKIIPREIAKKLLPRDFDIKRKLGFNLPLADLMRTSLWCKYIESAISEEVSQPFRAYIKSLFLSHLDGQNHSDRLFGAILLSKWVKHNNLVAPSWL